MSYAFCIVAESITPYRQDWQWFGDKNVFSDVGHLLLIDQVLQNSYAVATILVFGYLSSNQSVYTVPLIIIGVIYLEVSEYWRHRFLHEFDGRVHRVHVMRRSTQPDVLSADQRLPRLG